MRKNNKHSESRRHFLKTSAAGLASLPILRFNLFGTDKGNTMTKIALIKTKDRAQGVKEAMSLLEFSPMKGKKVLLKPNFNTADPAPASTHNDTLAQLVREIKGRGAADVMIGERSGPPATKQVMEDKGIFALSEELGFRVINFEELAEEDWVHFNPEGNHWEEGFFLAKPVIEAEYIVSTCSLKTHQFGGVFTMSLKLSVGMTPKRLMRQLHRSPDMRKMIAELNAGYRPQLIVMDGVEAFVDGGPSTGQKADPEVFIAGTDRIAVDAAGVAVLKEIGSNEAIMGQKIFDQEQIKRAVELGLGVSGPDQIEFVTADETSQAYADKLKAILARG